MSDAQIIFGNSGGAMYLQDSLEFIGVPSRIAVAQIGWSGDPITHMGFFIPFPRIWDWLESQYYHFVFDESVSYEWCQDERQKVQEQKRRMLDIQKAYDVDVDPSKQHGG